MMAATVKKGDATPGSARAGPEVLPGNWSLAAVFAASSWFVAHRWAGLLVMAAAWFWWRLRSSPSLRRAVDPVGNNRNQPEDITVTDLALFASLTVTIGVLLLHWGLI